MKPPSTRGVSDPILEIERLPYVYDSNSSGTKAVFPPDDTAPHGVDTPTAGIPLLAGVREAGGLHQLGARRFSKFVCHDLIGLILFIVK